MTSCPYTSFAGQSPKTLVGREEVLNSFAVTLGRARRGLGDKGIWLTGIHGIGKTVVLNEFVKVAEDEDYLVVFYKLSKSSKSFLSHFFNYSAEAIRHLSLSKNENSKVMGSERIFKSFANRWSSSGVIYPLDVEPLEGKADSGDLPFDLSALLVSLGSAAKEEGKVVLFLLDDIHHLDSIQLSALVSAKRQIIQRGLPIVLVFAGLPSAPSLTAGVKDYLHESFNFFEIKELNSTDARLALTLPALKLGVSYSEEAIDYILEYCHGSPMMIQEFGRQVWRHALDPLITLRDSELAVDTVTRTLDEEFFSFGVEEVPRSEQLYLKALAGLGTGEHSQNMIAKALNKDSSASIGSLTNRLLQRGLIYRSQRGHVAFTFPGFTGYVERHF